MKKELQILMIDDHPIIIEGYSRVLLTNKKRKLYIEKAFNCDEAIRAISKSSASKPFDVVFIDIQLPASKDGTVLSGEDVAVLVKKDLPKAKIIILTMFDNAHRLQNILDKIPHNGLLIKSDITSKLLLNAFEEILNNTVFYSKTVEKLRNNIVINNELLDEYNKEIIYYLSKGIKTINLTEHISLSLSAIEKRKSYIKRVFNIKGGDEQLLNEAKKRGLI